ncbi:MAG: BNR-4 repeat-containing protein [Marinilabiliaceae bacterium]|nr:BNR-4 repeat-containing protein [Marinilabiliaceae bacterium]
MNFISYATNYAISLPGGSNGVNSNVAIPALNLDSLPLTIELWYKPLSYNEYGGLLYYRGATTNGGIQYDKWTNNKTLRGIDPGGKQVVASNEPVVGEWNHVAYVVTKTDMTIYLNGVATTNSTDVPTLFTFDDGIYIGWDAATETRTVKGLFDEVRIWNVARTAQELNSSKYLTLTGLESGLVAYYNFNDQDTLATDVTGSGFDATINGGVYVESFDTSDPDGDGVPAFIDNCMLIANPDQADMDGDGVGDLCDNCPEMSNADQSDIDNDGAGDVCDTSMPDTLNYAISFPGVDGNTSNINISGLNITSLPLTIEMWVKPDGSQNWNAGLIYNRPANVGLQYVSSWYTGGADYVRFMASGGDQYAQPTSQGIVTPNAWSHLAIVLTSTTRTVYLNGEPLTETSTFNPIDWTTGSLYLGWDSDVANRAFKGLMDEVRIWNSARTKEDIETNMYTELVGDEDSLVAYYNFNDKASAATDLAGSHDGTIAGGQYVLSFSLDDKDGDGIVDMIDNCPDVANTDQADADFDGIGDVCDDDIEGEGIFDIVTNNGYVTASGTNFVSFQQNAIMTFNGYQYITYWNKDKQVCMARKQLPDGKWESIALTGYMSTYDLGDNHYNISFGICKNDGTIHLSFDHHNDEMNYRVSVEGLASRPDTSKWSAESFNPVQNYLEAGVVLNDTKFAGAITYPRFITKPNGDLLFECRTGWSGDGDSHLWEYSGTTHSWLYIGQYLHGRSDGMPNGYVNNCGYINGLHYTPGGTRLHVSLVWRDSPDANTNHDICYAYSDDDGRTWYNTAGNLIGTTGSADVSKLLNLYSNGFKILTVGQNRGLINQEGQAVDTKGRIHILQSYMKDGVTGSSWYDSRSKAFMRHIYQDENGVWHNDVIAESRIDRGDIAVDAADNVYVLGPDYRVYMAKAEEKWATWYEFDLSQDGKAVAEGLFDKEMLLEHNVLSFVLAHSDLKGRIIVPHYTLPDLPSKVVNYNDINQIRCYPNPFETSFSIIFEGKFEYSIYDLNGAIVEQGTGVNKLETGEKLSKGVYTLRIVEDNIMKCTKLVKM